MNFKWTLFLSKAWNEGLKVAVKEEIVEKTSNSFDDVALTMVDMALGNLITHFEKKELPKL